MKGMALCSSLIMLLLFFSSCGKEDVKDPINGQVQDFQVTDQDHQSFGLDDVKDKVWVANFMFTSCETICPPMTANLKRLQDAFKENNLEVEIVSFSVDPEVDTPEKLKAFAEKFQGDQTHWRFVTGYTQAFIEEFVMDSFNTIASKPENESQVIHGTSFYLVGKGGVVKKSYNGVSNTPYDEIVADAKILLK